MPRTAPPRRFAALSTALLGLLAAGCEVEKSKSPLSPSVAGPIAGVEITAPRPVEPSQGAKVKQAQQPIRLMIENASTNGVRPLSYSFELAADSTFATKLYAKAGIIPGDGGRTSVVLDRLELGRSYFWRARAEDGANSGPYVTAAFEILPQPQLNPPSLLSPINNERVTSLQPQLVVGSSTRNAAVGPVTYEAQVALDQAFAQLVAAGTSPEAGAQTTFIPSPLSASRTYYWRARASDGETTSPWADTQTFQTSAATPAPGPGPGPSPNPGGPCNSSNAETIVSCERAKYGFMSHDQMYGFLRTLIQSLNRNGISGGPFGLLRKESGTNCNGYSCDVVCAGQGGGQRQYDVLGDIDGAQTPGWRQVGPVLRVDICEVQ